MKKILFMVLIAVILFTAGCVSNPQSGEGIVITNSDGTKVVLNSTAERIVLLNSNAGEILYLLGDADKIVGISQSIANNAEQAKMYSNAVVVGTWNEPDVEYLISLKADIVVGYATSKPKNAEVLKTAGIPIVYVDCTKPETMSWDIVEVGKITGNSDKAKQISDFYESVISKINERLASVSAEKTVYAESYTAYWGQGTDSGMGQLIKIAKGENIMTDTGSRKISDEWVAASNPEIIVKLVNSMENADEQFKSVVDRVGFDKIDAVKEDNVWLIRNDLTYGPRSCAGAVELAKMIHPDLFKDMSAENILKEFNEKFGTDFDTKNITYPVL